MVMCISESGARLSKGLLHVKTAPNPLKKSVRAMSPKYCCIVLTLYNEGTSGWVGQPLWNKILVVPCAQSKNMMNALLLDSLHAAAEVGEVIQIALGDALPARLERAAKHLLV